MSAPPPTTPAPRPAASSEWVRELEAWAKRHVSAPGEPLLDVATPEFERTLIRVALAKCEGRRQDAAKVLGWGRNTLTRKMRELGMDDNGRAAGARRGD